MRMNTASARGCKRQVNCCTRSGCALAGTAAVVSGRHCASSSDMTATMLHGSAQKVGCQLTTATAAAIHHVSRKFAAMRSSSANSGATLNSGMLRVVLQQQSTHTAHADQLGCSMASAALRGVACQKQVFCHPHCPGRIAKMQKPFTSPSVRRPPSRMARTSAVRVIAVWHRW
jgi:hypothetical protein